MINVCLTSFQAKSYVILCQRDIIPSAISGSENAIISLSLRIRDLAHTEKFREDSDNSSIKVKILN